MVGSIIFSLVIILVSILIFRGDDIIGPLLTFFFICLAIHMLLNDFYMKIYRRPISVAFNENGPFLRFRWSEPRQIEWDEIELVHTSSHKDGSLVVKDEKRAYFLAKHIIEEIRRKYHLAEGRNPPDMKEYWDNQPAGWKKDWTQPMWTKDKK